MKKFVRTTFSLLTVLALIIFLLACLTPFISPVDLWPLTFFALGFPIIAIGFATLIVIWIFVKRRVALYLLIVFMVPGYKNLHSTFALNIPGQFSLTKNKSTLRIITWNVRYFNDYNHVDSPNSVRQKMLSYLKTADADVIMFQDYVDYHRAGTYSNITTMRDSLGFKYCYTTKDVVSVSQVSSAETGCALYSKLPLVDTGKVIYPQMQESIGHVDVLYGQRRIRIITTHLASMSIHPGANLNKDFAANEYDSAYLYSRTITSTLKQYDKIHTSQALLVKQQITKSPYPVIFGGDLNSVPSSYVYHTIRGNLQDVFINKGFNIGSTYYGLSNTLRIDYLLIDPSFSVLQTATPHLYLSDHFPVVADIQFK